MGFQNVALLLSRASISTIFLDNCGRGESLGTTKYLRDANGGKQGHDPCKVLLLRQTLY